MLVDLQSSIELCFRRWLPAKTEIRFDPPDPTWPADEHATPFVDAFLFDLREDTSATAADSMLVRDAEGRAAGWQAPIRRYRAAFLVSAWCGKRAGGAARSRAVSDAQLLSALLWGCSAGAIPGDCLTGSLAEAPVPVLLRCAPAEVPNELAQVWASLGVRARLSLQLLAVAPLVPPLCTELAPAARSLKVGVERQGDQPTDGQQGRPRQWESSAIVE